MNSPQDNPAHRHSKDLAAFKAALMEGTPVSRGKARSAAAAQEARSAGAEPVQTNANKVNHHAVPQEGVLGASAPAVPGFLPVSKTPEELYEDRLENAELRRSTRQISGLKRVQKCCHTVRREAGVGVVYDYEAKPENRVSGFRGLYTCGSVWACDRCAALIQRERFLEVKKCMDQWMKDGATIPTQFRDYGPEGPEGRGILWENEPGEEQILGPAGYVDSKNGGIVWPGVNDSVLNDETGEISLRPLRRFNLIDRDVKHPAGAIAFMTLTMGHEAATGAGSKWAAEKIWGAESAAFKVFTNGKFFKGNVHAYQRSVEVQWSARAGWHVHIHVALFVSKSFRSKIVDARGALFTAWESAVALQGYQAKKAGFDLRMTTSSEKSAAKLAQYVTKGSGSKSLAAEMTLNGEKKSRFSLSPAQLRGLLHENRMGRTSADIEECLRLAVGRTAKPQERLLLIYQEFERASRGKRWMTWSRGAKKAFGILEVEDEVVAGPSEAELNGDELPEILGSGELGGFRKGDWRAFARELSNPVSLRGVVEAQQTKAAGLVALQEWADARDVPVVVGAAWDAHLEEISARQDAEAPKKAPKWASGIHTGAWWEKDEDEYTGLRGSGQWRGSSPEELHAEWLEMWEEEFASSDSALVLWEGDSEAEAFEPA